jgi:hypothetical protein
MPPTQLLGTLESFRRRVRILALAAGVGITLAAAVGLLVLTVLLDYALNLPAVPRLIVIAAALVACGYALFQYVVHPLLARLSISDIAGKLESAFPQFDDRLRSTVAILTGGIPGSEVMKQRVVSETTTLASTMDLNRALVVKPVVQSVSMGVMALLLAVMMTVLMPTYSRIAMSRLLNPFHAAAWPKRVQIALPENMPTRYAAGDRIPVRINLAKGDRASMRPVVFYQYDGGPVQQEYMPRDASSASFVASLDAKADPAKALGSLKVWVKAGDDEMVLPAITVVPRLTIRSVEASITPPSYTGLPAQTFNLGTAPASATIHSQVELKVVFNKALDRAKSVEILPAGEGEVPGLRAQGSAGVQGSGFSKTFLATESMHFRIRATDIDGFTNTAIEEYELLVKPDQLPTVQIENPRRNEERTAVAVVPLQGMAEDDFAIKTMTLEIERLNDKKHWSVPLVTDSAAANSDVAWTPLDVSADRRRFRANWQWDLAALKDASLKPADILEYNLLVTDNYNFNGSYHQPVPSSKLRITIVSQEEFAAHLTDTLRAVAAQVGEVAKNQMRTSEETSSLAKDTQAKEKLDDGDRAAAERLSTQQTTAASATKQIAGKLSDLLNQMEENKSTAKELHDIANDAKDILDNAAENPMKNAVSAMSTAREPKTYQNTRNNAFAQTTNNQEQASAALQRAMERMGNLGNLRQAIDTIKSLLKDQQAVTSKTANDSKNVLGKKPEELAAGDKAKLDKNAADQKNLAGRTDKALKDMEKVAETMSKSDPSTAEAMKQAAQAGQTNQVSPNQSQASQAISQNQQAQAQASQRQAEAGLQAMLDKLREAEKRKLAELSEKLATLQQQLANLVRRQAGHNLDNITVQGPLQVKKLDAATLADLLTLSMHKDDAPIAQLTALSPAQEQTERNTRDVSKMAEDLPNAADVASALIRAAGKMERAIVSLRVSKLPEAYEPPQVDALSALRQAKARVDELKKEVDKQLQQNQKETLRAAYVAIRADQEKVNKETSRIDGAPRAEDKQYRREDVVRLNQLVTQQGGLSDRAAALTDDLIALGGNVYVWANRDLVTSMNGVKDDLGKPTTAKPTQVEQQRILDQLDGMIASLDVKPLQKEFEQRGGGGGGVCKKKLPTEAEFRLLKALQVAVNKATADLDQPERDKPRILALGTRQGELRNLLDSMLQKASGGQSKLPPEPNPKDRLPDEAKPEDVDNQEIDKSLLNDKTDEAATAKVDKETGQIGDRLARIRQRLALDNDPGKVTQLIEKKVLGDLDVLIEEARKQEAQGKPDPNQKPQLAQGQQPRQIGNKMNQPSNQGKQGSSSKAGATPANNSNAAGPALSGTDVSQDIQSNMKEWGGLTPRQRDAIIEGSGDTVIEKYKPLVDDYYRSLATKATERQ